MKRCHGSGNLGLFPLLSERGDRAKRGRGGQVRRTLPTMHLWKAPAYLTSPPALRACTPPLRRRGNPCGGSRLRRRREQVRFWPKGGTETRAQSSGSSKL